MARMPGAVWRPLAANYTSQPKMKTYDLVVIHTAVGSLGGTYSHFASGNGAGYAGTESHFMTGGKGEIHQYQDTAYQAEANGAGNYRIISIENADVGPEFPAWNLNDGGAVPAFTAEQIEANAQILAWAHREHGIPLELVSDSKPGRRGIGYHRLGVPGYAVAGGELWSSARGKVCPGNRRIAQIPQIIARARQIVGGAPITTGEDWLAMATKAEVRAIIAEEVAKVLRAEGVSGSADEGRLRKFIAEETAKVLRVEGVSGAGDVGRLAAALARTGQPSQIAAALPADFARQLADELVKKLAS